MPDTAGLKLLLCTDLDRTLLPNGPQTEPAGARQLFTRLVSQDGIQLAYVSGRSRALVLDAIAEYQLPVPDFAICDVGTNIYRIEGDKWSCQNQWHELMAKDWRGMNSWQLREALPDYAGLTLQPEHKQDQFKLSFELTPSAEMNERALALKNALSKLDLDCNVVASVDETHDMALVDVLPQSANKRLAIEYLIKQLGILRNHVVFSGDSGNDLDVLLSPIPSVLVGNATEEVRSVAIAAIDKGQGESVYFANEYYAAGIVEGFLHYFPACQKTLYQDGEP
ncbi:MAG: HAD-IIB family hydrolase [Ketobacteraceae bacterium]|nr:HAD-IIB family hydrolase [Ketobacteraceae bacterium]